MLDQTNWINNDQIINNTDESNIYQKENERSRRGGSQSVNDKTVLVSVAGLNCVTLEHANMASKTFSRTFHCTHIHGVLSIFSSTFLHLNALKTSLDALWTQYLLHEGQIKEYLDCNQLSECWNCSCLSLSENCELLKDVNRLCWRILDSFGIMKWSLQTQDVHKAQGVSVWLEFKEINKEYKCSDSVL